MSCICVTTTVCMYLIPASSDGSIPPSRIPLLAAVAGSMVTRTASRRAFSKNGRGVFDAFCQVLLGTTDDRTGVVTQDMIPEIGGAFAEVFGEGEKGWGASTSGGKL